MPPTKRPPEENPFRVLSAREVYDNPWIRVVEHQILNPKGKPGIYGVVEFKARAVGVVPFEDGRIWLVGQYRFTLGVYSWEIPEGGAKPGEPLEAAARRELKEETGLGARTVEPLLEMHLSNSITNEQATVFLARGLEPGEAAPDDTEELAVRVVTLEEATRLVCEGAITDSMSVAGILRVALLARGGAL